jgi:hypothetical protein
MMKHAAQIVARRRGQAAIAITYRYFTSHPELTADVDTMSHLFNEVAMPFAPAV